MSRGSNSVACCVSLACVGLLFIVLVSFELFSVFFQLISVTSVPFASRCMYVACRNQRNRSAAVDSPDSIRRFEFLLLRLLSRM